MNPKDHAVTEMIFNPQSVASNGAVSATWDLNGRGSWATLIIPITASNTDSDDINLKLEESDESAANFATVVATSGHDVPDTNATQSVVMYEVDLRGRKRYLKLTLTAGNNDANDVFTAAAVGRIHHLYEGPTNTTDMVSTTNDVVIIP